MARLRALVLLRDDIRSRPRSVCVVHSPIASSGPDVRFLILSFLCSRFLFPS